jgi:hypothetical protein
LMRTTSGEIHLVCKTDSVVLRNSSVYILRCGLSPKTQGGIRRRC